MIKIVRTEQLKEHVVKKYPNTFKDKFAEEMLDNIIDNMQEVPHSEQFNYLLYMIPNITEEELNQFLY